MASVAALSSSAVSTFVQRSFTEKAVSSSHVQGLPALRRSRVACSTTSEQKPVAKVSAAAAAAASFVLTQPALAVVDERLGGEGTGLVLGLSNPALGWILFGVATLIWTGYFAYSSSLPDGDDDSGLSL